MDSLDLVLTKIEVLKLVRQVLELEKQDSLYKVNFDLLDLKLEKIKSILLIEIDALSYKAPPYHD